MTSDCQTSLGAAASKRIHELRGRLRGSGVTSPPRGGCAGWSRSTGLARPSRPRCQAIVTGPASSPRAVSSVRSVDDPGADLVRRPAGAGERTAGTRLEGLEPAVTVAAEQALEMLTTDPVLGRGGGDGQLRGDDLQDGHPMLRHAPELSRMSRLTWRLSAVAYVLDSDTSGRARTTQDDVASDLLGRCTLSSRSWSQPRRATDNSVAGGSPAATRVVVVTSPMLDEDASPVVDWTRRATLRLECRQPLNPAATLVLRSSRPLAGRCTAAACREMLPHIPDESVDLALAEEPVNFGDRFLHLSSKSVVAWCRSAHRMGKGTERWAP